jgi:aliphatic nitrilase
MSDTPSVRLAAVQAAPVFLDRDATVAKAERLIAEAGANGAELVGFPETWIPCYPLWIFGATGWDDPDAKRAFARLHANAVEVPSPAVDRLCRAARAAGAMVVMGINERDGGTLYNSLLFISAQGEVLGVRRKLMPTHAERVVWGRGDGSALQVYDTPLGRVGGAI